MQTKLHTSAAVEEETVNIPLAAGEHLETRGEEEKEEQTHAERTGFAARVRENIW